MMIAWRVSKKRLYNSPCVELSVTYDGKKKGDDRELGLFGKYGMIWEYSKKEARIYITSKKIANKHGEGKILLNISNKDVSKWLSILKVPRTRQTQAKYANSFKET